MKQKVKIILFLCSFLEAPLLRAGARTLPDISSNPWVYVLFLTYLGELYAYCFVPFFSLTYSHRSYSVVSDIELAPSLWPCGTRRSMGDSLALGGVYWSCSHAAADHWGGFCFSPFTGDHPLPVSLLNCQEHSETWRLVMEPPGQRLCGFMVTTAGISSEKATVAFFSQCGHTCFLILSTQILPASFYLYWNERQKMTEWRMAPALITSL